MTAHPAHLTAHHTAHHNPLISNKTHTPHASRACIREIAHTPLHACLPRTVRLAHIYTEGVRSVGRVQSMTYVRLWCAVRCAPRAVTAISRARPLFSLFSFEEKGK